MVAMLISMSAHVFDGRVFDGRFDVWYVYTCDHWLCVSDVNSLQTVRKPACACVVVVATILPTSM